MDLDLPVEGDLHWDVKLTAAIEALNAGKADAGVGGGGATEEEIAEAITAHTQAADPHGDRAAASDALNEHVSATDPHGDRAAAIGALAGHVAATDPHGDRAAASTALSAHTSAVDPHGDRAVASTALTSHVAATDPHGDRAAASGALSTHVAATDPHGDRAYAVAMMLSKTANLSDVANPAAARTSLGLGTAATRGVGTSSASVAAGDDSRILGAVQGAVWRRRDLPDQVSAEGLYAGTAPLVSTAQTTTPTSGYIKFAPSGVALSGSDVTGPFTYAGAGSFSIGSVSPDTSYVLPLSKYPNTYATPQGVWSVEFGTDAQIMQLRFRYMSATATSFRMSIDGRKVTDLMQLVSAVSGVGTTGNGHLLTIDLGSAAPRRIRFDFTTMPFGGIYLPPSATMWKVALQGGRFMTFTDSLGDGSAINTGAGCGTWVDRVGRMSGATDIWRQGRGGTGYITPGIYATFGDRVQNDVIALNPARLIIWGGYNDNQGSQSAIAAAAASLYSAIKTGLPNCQTFVIGCWSPMATPATSMTNTDETLRSAAATAAFPFVSPLTGSIYDSTGSLLSTHGPWVTSGNATAYIGNDNTHPTDAGHVYLSRRIMTAIREVLPP
ncbi:GDSL-type esterase/lipase family protein [Streptomyces tubercidicus]|uniref:GDSL-type esterase/lipase family protein n=1 Tax=Streptomyces tubercidicus TaxID=47759 RepID=UPI00368E316A